MNDPLKGSALPTRCVHAGHRPTPVEPSVVTPIVRATAFLLTDEAYAAREAGPYEDSRVYSRESGPGIEALERRLASLEGAEQAVVYASGLAALHAILMAHAASGRPVASAARMYGGSVGLLHELSERLGLERLPCDLEDDASVSRALDRAPSLLLVESLANPGLEVADLPRLAERCRAAGTLLVVDATFASPILQRPLEHGADLVWHSATKVLGGHSDLLGGVVTGARKLVQPCRHWRTVAGAALDPAAAYLLERGIKTLALRVERMSANATALAEFLASACDVLRVRHPSSFEGAEQQRAEALLDGPGWMLCFELAGGDERAGRFTRSLGLAIEAASLGGVETLVSQPCRMSHGGLTLAQRLAAGVLPGQVRVSVGIEAAEDLIRDFEAALQASS